MIHPSGRNRFSTPGQWNEIWATTYLKTNFLINIMIMHIKSVYITTFQQSTWGRVYVCFEKDNQLFYAFKNFINFAEHNFLGGGEIIDEPAFHWFSEEKRFEFSDNEVLEGKADHLFLTPDKYKQLYGTPSILLKRLLIDIYSNNLTPVEKRRGWFEHFHIPAIRLSELHITKDFKQLVLTDFQTELVLEPLMKTLYVFYLKHPEGVKRTELVDYTDELQLIYTQITNKSDLEKVNKSIESLVDNSGKSFDEKISKIKKYLTDLLGEKIAENYTISKSETEEYKIKIDFEKIKFD